MTIGLRGRLSCKISTIEYFGFLECSSRTGKGGKGLVSTKRNSRLAVRLMLTAQGLLKFNVMGYSKLASRRQAWAFELNLSSYDLKVSGSFLTHYES